MYLLPTVASLITYLFLLYANITTSAHLVACRKIRILDIVTWSNSTRADSKKHWVRPLGIQYSYLMRLDMLDSWESLFNSVLDENCPWREKRVKRARKARARLSKPIARKKVKLSSVSTTGAYKICAESWWFFSLSLYCSRWRNQLWNRSRLHQAHQ